MNMEKRIILERRGRDPSQVKELNLDNCRSTNIVGLTDEYTNLQILSLNNVGLTTLKGFPTLPMLRKLELSDNRISNGLTFLSGCKKLAHLNLSGNKIKDLETLKPLEAFKNLKNLDLFNNDVTSIEDYKSKVFAMHPSLKYLDGFDKYDQEADDSDIEEEDEMNGNNDSDEDGSDEEEEEEDEDDEDVSLCAVYNAEEESSSSSIFEGSDVEEEEEVDEEDDEGENNADGEQEQNSKGQDGDADGEPEESTRGKKRKHEDDDEN
ncbi:acidic leucine-rich nuclear phosphoprotein 32 family member A isoform X2 [Bombyx mandarina]|uniref:Acidic leucine-rich nuclear phosphoprotein 32 family member A n=2 Tax=Bombyx TaxID=7090 RepID=A0A8R1WFP3_BOMMO|nr:acidic leucine-rich nuclear phosphoprotein 32 family member A isoform X2 [Bombyx mori]XP_028025855.1 acidic leucine-rich nuclear phosphoprotein 32 family member A isoform X2 [Bombyx mandarina]